MRRANNRSDISARCELLVSKAYALSPSIELRCIQTRICRTEKPNDGSRTASAVSEGPYTTCGLNCKNQARSARSNPTGASAHLRQAADFEHETAPEVYSSAREQASHLFGLPRPSGHGVTIPVQLAGDVRGRSTHDRRGVRAAECGNRRIGFAQPAPPR